jgi:protein-disulfide isomerase
MQVFSSLSYHPQLTVPLGPPDHTRGPAAARATLVEYGDFQCPFCGQAYGVVEAVLEALGDQVQFAFRHFPLTEMHPPAQLAAEAAEAAGAQGRFWEMHHLLFEHQNQLDEHSLLGYARLLGLDLDAFAAALTTGSYIPRVERDFVSGVRSGVNGTPTFFINGLRYDGSPDFHTLAFALRSQ